MLKKRQQRPRLYSIGFLLKFEMAEQRRSAVEILGAIGIEKRIDRGAAARRLFRKRHGREPIARRPYVHLADILIDQRPPQLVA